MFTSKVYVIAILLQLGKCYAFCNKLPTHAQTFKSNRRLTKPVNFEDTIIALFTYKKLNGNLLVSQSFSIPTLDEIIEYERIYAQSLDTGSDSLLQNLSEWRNVESMLGVRLGLRVNKLREQSRLGTLSLKAHEILTNEGFIWDVRKYKFEQFQNILEAFTQVYGHAQVPLSFVVPNANDTKHVNQYRSMTNLVWPEGSEGYKLGEKKYLASKGKLFHDFVRSNHPKLSFPYSLFSNSSDFRYLCFISLFDSNDFMILYINAQCAKRSA